MKLRIGKILSDRGLRAARLADELGTSPGYLSLLINNKRAPSAEMLTKIARALDLPVSDLIEADGTGGGFGENTVKPLDLPAESVASMLRLIGISAKHPTIYELKSDRPEFGLRAGDRLAADLNYTLETGDIVLATHQDNESPSTGIYRWLDPWLDPGQSIGQPLRLDNSGKTAILARVSGSLRTM